MMDKKNANGFSSKAPESTGQRKQLPYSVETPYGFHIDLDFLKYVDDIEKGNTIKRVHIQRRSKGPKFSTLPRNFSLPGHASRNAPKDTWTSTCTLGPKAKSRVMEVQQIYDFRPCDTRSAGYPRAPGVNYKSIKAVEEATIRAFDEQPLGLHVRPHLLRASSMPVTVLRKHSEPTELQGPQGSAENGSYDNVFCPPDVVDGRSSMPGERTGLHQQFTTALLRIRELEEQVQTIPALRAQICSLQEEKEQLLLRLNSQPPATVGESRLHGQCESGVFSEQRTGSAGVCRIVHVEPNSEQPADDRQSVTQEPESYEQEKAVQLSDEQLEVQDESADRPSLPDLDKSEETSEVAQEATKHGGTVESSLVVEEELLEQAEGSHLALEVGSTLVQESERELEELASPSQQEVMEWSPSAEKDTDNVLTKRTSPSEHESAYAELITESLSTKQRQEAGLETNQSGREAEDTSVQEDVVSEGTEGLPYQQANGSTEDLTIQALELKLRALEEEICQVKKELENTTALLSGQMEENMLKEGKIKQLTQKIKAYDQEENPEVDEQSGDSVVTSLSLSSVLYHDVTTWKNLSVMDVALSAGETARRSTGSLSSRRQEKDVTSSSAQTDIVGSEDRGVSASVITAEKCVETEVAMCDQAVETDPQETPPGTIPEEPTGSAEGPERRAGRAGSDRTASDCVETAGSLVQVRQSSRKEREARPRHGEGEEPPATQAAVGQYVTRIQSLLNEQWACLGSGHPEIASTLKQPASRMSSIQTQLVSSLNALSSFYSSQGHKGTAARQAGLKSIMKKKGCGERHESGGAKKNLKFVGVNGGYETTSSEDESSGEDNVEEDSSEPEEQAVGRTSAPTLQEPTQEDPEKKEPEEEPEEEEAVAADTDPSASATDVDPKEERSEGEKVDEDFMAACLYLKDRLAEVACPDKEMRQVLMVLYQHWFCISSQKDSLVDTVTLHLKEVAAAAPTLLRFLVNLADGNGNTALHYSVSHSNFPIVKLLLDTGLCDVDHQNKAGYTAIMLASLATAEDPDEPEVVLQLLRQGDVNTRASQGGQTALMLAVSHGRTAAVRLLLACQADVNAQDCEGTTALMTACEHGHAEVMRLLLEGGCDTNLTDKEGRTALDWAAKAASAEIVALLKSCRGAEPCDTQKPH